MKTLIEFLLDPTFHIDKSVALVYKSGDIKTGWSRSVNFVRLGKGLQRRNTILSYKEYSKQQRDNK